ncbi:acriflavin resistance protein [Lucifera butyrica]|uniref:Acriflavin resistance protein n=1 Tax=Lucifera butyrica TaxID=1351585 RepID=A0A498RB66_9FIRM|nr:efflux RND transporter permease subunit [Lucifera butyrica]VBB08190.1 acriflavin resistance protein [Lucifera butyrica]
MKNSNLAEWALKHKQFIYFFMALFFTTGLFSYINLGRMEDPDFTIKQMVVSVAWPGATARQMEEQVTDKVEKKLQDLPGLDYLQSDSRPGQTIIYVNLKDTVPKKDVRAKWLEVRNMVNDMAATLPTGVQPPQFNDRFDDVYGIIYALTGDGYTYEELREKAEKIRRILRDVPSVKKVELLGTQTESIYINIENSKMARLGIDPALITGTIQAQNSMTAAGMLETSTDNVYLRLTGMFERVEDIRTLPITAGGRTFRLGDIAKVTRAYAEPADPEFFYNGQPAIGIAVSMESGGNILTLGKRLETTIARIQQELPAGLEIHQTVNQPKIVENSINEFVKSLAEAILIIFIVSFASLGMRPGFVVALCIPFVLAVVFTIMYLKNIDLQRISLGALIIALGLLVDDAMIVIEMMAVKLEQGWERLNAAAFAYSATAFPMLTGTLVTCAGFIPVGFAQGSASEYCSSIFSVINIALIISWIVAATVTPLLGYLFIQPAATAKNKKENPVYDSRPYRLFKQMLSWCLTHRKIVLTATLVLFIASVGLLTLVKEEFFPASTRPELIVQLKLQDGASLKNTAAVAGQLARKLNGDPLIAYYTYHVGEGAPRFVLTFDPTFNRTNFAEFVIVAKNTDARNQLHTKINRLLAEEFPSVQVHMKVISNGTSADYPVMLRVEGYDHDKVRAIAKKVQTVMAANPNTKNVNMNWYEKSKIMHLSIDQDKARNLGITSESLAAALQTDLSGINIAEFRQADRTIPVILRFDAHSRNDPARVKDLSIPIGSGNYIPLAQIAKISFEAEDGLIYRRDLKPAILVQAEIKPGVTGDDVTRQVYESLHELRAGLPPGYTIQYDGSTEESIKETRLLMAPVPAMMIIIMILLMLQLQNIPKMILTLLTAPLGIIGVAVGLFLTGKPVGFVVQLGILALSGIIMRNSVILIDQIDQHLAVGENVRDSIINAAVTRLRPILLTAAAAILAMIPLVSNIFWGPMAVAIGSGLFAATVLTLLVLPVMYAAWYKV